MPSRGCPSSASKIAASSSTERPIVPPAPAEFSSTSQSRSSVSSRSSRSGGTARFRPFADARAEVRAEVEDDAVGADRGCGVERGAHRRDRLLVDLAVGRGEIDEVEGVTDDRLDPDLVAARAEPLDLVLGVRRRPPHPRALREDLHGVAAELLGAVDRLRDPACRRDVCAEQHGWTLQRVSGLDDRLVGGRTRATTLSVRVDAASRTPRRAPGARLPAALRRRPRSRRPATGSPGSRSPSPCSTSPRRPRSASCSRFGRASRRSSWSAAASSPTACPATSCSSGPRSSRESPRPRPPRASSREPEGSRRSSSSRRVYGLGLGLVIPAEVGLVPQTVRPERLQQANALQGMTRNLVGVLGPAIGGVVVVLGQPRDRAGARRRRASSSAPTSSVACACRRERTPTRPASSPSSGRAGRSSRRGPGSGRRCSSSGSATSPSRDGACSGRRSRRSASAAPARGLRSSPPAASAPWWAASSRSGSGPTGRWSRASSPRC